MFSHEAWSGLPRAFSVHHELGRNNLPPQSPRWSALGLSVGIYTDLMETFFKLRIFRKLRKLRNLKKNPSSEMTLVHVKFT